MPINVIRWVLVPIDFSEASRAAATRAAWIAHRLGASLHFVHATDGHEAPLVYGGAGMGASWWHSGRERANRELARDELSALASHFEFLGPKITYEVVAGKPLAVVRESIRQGRGDLVVLGVHPHHAWWHLVADTTSDRAIRVLPRPVIAVKEDDVQAGEPVRQLLAMTDFSPHADAALAFAIRLAQGFGAKLDLLHALSLSSQTYFPYDAPPPPEWIERVRRHAAQQLTSALDRVHRAGLEGDMHLYGGGPLGAISNEIAADADLIVMGTRGHTGLKHMIFGSVAERTLHHAHCSVAVVH